MLSSKVETFCGILSSVMDEILGMKAGDVVPLVIGHGHVELHQDNVYAKMHRIVLGRWFWRSTTLKKEQHEKRLRST